MPLQKSASTPGYAVLTPVITLANENAPIRMEVSVKDKERKTKLLLIVELHLEALRLAGNMSANQRRFIEVALTCGPELEPSGLLAGRKS
jgi:ABC-type branched-subunit amino acid transport system ATPase component